MTAFYAHTQLRALAVLTARYPDAMGLTELAAVIDATYFHTAHVVRDLVERGLVEKLPRIDNRNQFRYCPAHNASKPEAATVRALRLFREQRVSSSVDLARELNLSKSHSTRIIRRLRNRGLIEARRRSGRIEPIQYRIKNT
ncbi:MarR family transcriptional regulator [Spirosoma sp. 209]|uniref:MarR family transcriptional regulator n=1 Tax=Spirosoma sp. 209 TaxID=1955701 RepID=UPI00098D1C03|nr:MarR family transcriptional regulator [Spirosoma sp. 209]